jgi:hypothetical protein
MSLADGRDGLPMFGYVGCNYNCRVPGRHPVTEDRILSSTERNNVLLYVVEFIFLSNKMHILALDLIFPPVNRLFFDKSLSASASVES